MPSGVLRSIRLRIADAEDFKTSAETAGLSLNAWVVRACRQVAENERAVRRMEEREQSVLISKDEARKLIGLPKVKKPRSSMCAHRLAPTAFCSRCDS